jgi:hypothetical protein
VHWGVGLNKKTVARFYYPKDAADLRLMIGGSAVACVCVCGGGGGARAVSGCRCQVGLMGDR